MTQFHGKFVWYELLTHDVSQAEAFYKDVVGWSCRAADLAAEPDVDYRLFVTSNGAAAGGYFKMPERIRERGARSGWVGYIQTDDIDATTAQLTAEGGTIRKTPTEIPGVGRFAVVTDFQRAKFGLIQQPVEPPQNGLGHVGWHELYAANYATVFPFYEKLFGWVRTGAIEMPDLGPYQMFAIGEEHPRGGMLDKPEVSEIAFWLFYFNVASVDAAAERILALDGEILQAPMQVPGGQWIVQAEDFEGNKFAVVAPVK